MEQLNLNPLIPKVEEIEFIHKKSREILLKKEISKVF